MRPVFFYPDPMTDNSPLLADFFQTNIAPEELPMLQPLLGARPLLGTFIALFRGGEEEVYVRLLVLREIGARADAPRWSPQELQQHFAYLNPVKLETVLKRLREHGLLVWDADNGLYELSDPARAALAALSTLLGFASQPDQELDYLTSQVAAGQSVGQVSLEAMKHLLAALNKLYQEFTDALESQSEFRIQAAQGKLDRVWRSVEKATAVARSIYTDDATPGELVSTAQAISLSQSRLLNLMGTFKRRLAQLQQQRVHLGHSGLTTRDITTWLRNRSQNELAHMLFELLPVLPDPVFVTSDELLDVAEFELIDRERQADVSFELPPPASAADTHIQEEVSLLAATRFFERLNDIDQPTTLSDALLASDYATTAYRLSLLSLLGDPDSEVDHSVVADLAALPLALAADGDVEHVDHPAVSRISRGHLQPKDYVAPVVPDTDTTETPLQETP